MNITQAIEILERHQEWRKGADTGMVNPAVLSKAIDVILKFVKETAPIKTTENWKNRLLRRMKQLKRMRDEKKAPKR